MKRCNKHKEWGVIDTTCRDCKREEERAEYIGLMNGDLADMKPVRNYPLDDKGVIDNALILHGEV